MTDNVTHLFPCRTSVPSALRNIADRIEAGEFNGKNATILLDSTTMFYLGDVPLEYIAPMVVFDATLLLQRATLMVVTDVVHG